VAAIDLPAVDLVERAALDVGPTEPVVPGEHLAPLDRRQVAVQAARCVVRSGVLVARRELHVDPHRPGWVATLPDGRAFHVYRSTWSSEPAAGELVVLSVWFRLRAVPAHAWWRRWLFERESLLNTLLFAGFPGYRTKWWMVDLDTNEFAGRYTWVGRDAAERYARYITSLLRPLSVPGSVGVRIDRPDPTDS
jgi:hypothetical protein